MYDDPWTDWQGQEALSETRAQNDRLTAALDRLDFLEARVATLEAEFSLRADHHSCPCNVRLG